MQSLLYVRGEIKALAGAIDVIADDVQAQKGKILSCFDMVLRRDKVMCSMTYHLLQSGTL